MTHDSNVVDDRVFLLGLDKLYRDAMRLHERSELLACARKVAKLLRASPAEVPVEGYYAEEEALTEYFLLLRALQGVDREARASVDSRPEFQRLFAVASSPIFGVTESAGLLPAGRDALSRAMDERRPWTLGSLVAAAGEISRATDDISLVGLAALAGDSVMLAATRESVVAWVVKVMCIPPPGYAWEVDDELARRARKFVDTFNRLFGEELPPPEPAQAKRYWDAHEENHILGRCVHLGYDNTMSPSYYHWAICDGPDGGLVVKEFWKDEIWTTARYNQPILRHSSRRRH